MTNSVILYCATFVERDHLRQGLLTETWNETKVSPVNGPIRTTVHYNYVFFVQVVAVNLTTAGLGIIDQSGFYLNPHSKKTIFLF